AAAAAGLRAAVRRPLGPGGSSGAGGALWGGPERGGIGVIGPQRTPLVWGGSLLTTIDPPFLVLWTLGLWAAHRALSIGRASAWLLLGLAIGLGSLAKYTMLFALPGLVLYLVLAPDRRSTLPTTPVGPAPLPPLPT